MLKAESFTQSSFFPTEFIYINVFNVKTSISVKYLPNQRLWGGWLQKLYELLNIYLPWLCNAQRILGTWCICNVHWLFFVLELFFLCSLPLINFFAWNFLNSCFCQCLCSECHNVIGWFDLIGAFAEIWIVLHSTHYWQWFWINFTFGTRKREFYNLILRFFIETVEVNFYFLHLKKI